MFSGTMAKNPMYYREPQANPPTLQPFVSMRPQIEALKTLRLDTLKGFADEQAKGSPPRQRSVSFCPSKALWSTISKYTSGLTCQQADVSWQTRFPLYLLEKLEWNCRGQALSFFLVIRGHGGTRCHQQVGDWKRSRWRTGVISRSLPLSRAVREDTIPDVW